MRYSTESLGVIKDAIKLVASKTPRWCLKLKYAAIGIFHMQKRTKKILRHLKPRTTLSEDIRPLHHLITGKIIPHLQFGNLRAASILSRGTIGVRNRISLWPTTLKWQKGYISLNSMKTHRSTYYLWHRMKRAADKLIVKILLSVEVFKVFKDGKLNSRGSSVGPINDGNAFVKYQCTGCFP